MIEINGKSFKLCFIDTNIVSNLLKHKETIGNRLVKMAYLENIIYCVTIHTFRELYKRKEHFEELFPYFNVIPFYFLKSYSELLQDEINEYPNKNCNDITLIKIPLLKGSEYYENIKSFFYTEEFIKTCEQEENESEEVLNSILEYVDKCPLCDGPMEVDEVASGIM